MSPQKLHSVLSVQPTRTILRDISRLSNSGPIMRELLRNSTPMEVAALSETELQLAILNAMAERARTPTGGMANRNQPAAELNHHAAMAGNLSHVELRDLQQRLERAFRRAFDSLEQNRLIEPASGLNGHNGYVVLTPEGVEASKQPIDFDAVRIRALLRPEMLHAKLRDRLSTSPVAIQVPPSSRHSRLSRSRCDALQTPMPQPSVRTLCCRRSTQLVGRLPTCPRPSRRATLSRGSLLAPWADSRIPARTPTAPSPTSMSRSRSFSWRAGCSASSTNPRASSPHRSVPPLSSVTSASTGTVPPQLSHIGGVWGRPRRRGSGRALVRGRHWPRTGAACQARVSARPGDDLSAGPRCRCANAGDATRRPGPPESRTPPASQSRPRDR